MNTPRTRFPKITRYFLLTTFKAKRVNLTSRVNGVYRRSEWGELCHEGWQSQLPYHDFPRFMADLTEICCRFCKK
jgi:hypothetical protein